MPHSETFLWAGGYSPGMGGTARGIGLLRWDGARLSFEGTVSETISPSYLLADAGVLFAADEETGRVRSFSAGASGELSPLGDHDGVATSGAHPCHLSALHVDGRRMLLVANYGSGTVDLMERDSEGAATGRLASFSGKGSGPRPEQESPHAHSTLPLPRAPGVLLSADLGTDLVHSLSWDGDRLEARGELALPPGTGPRDLVLAGERILLLGEFGGGLFELGAGDDGSLRILASSSSVSDPSEGDQAAGLVLGPGGRFLYAGLRGSNRVAVIDAASLAPVASVPCGGDWPRHLAFVGDMLFVSNQRSGSVAAFRTDGENGIPQLVDVAAVPTPTCLVPVTAGA